MFRGQKCEGSKFSREMCFRRSYVLMRSLRETPSMRLLPKNSRDLSKLGLLLGASWRVVVVGVVVVVVGVEESNFWFLNSTM